MYKKLNYLKKSNKLKAVHPQTNENKVVKRKVLDNVGDLFNELYCIYKDKYNEEKDGLNAKNKKILHYKKLRLTDYYQYESEQEKEQQTSKTPDKKLTKDRASNFNEWVNKKESDISSEIFQKYFSFQRSSDMLKILYTTNDKKKNSKLVNIIKSGLSDSRNEVENMGEEGKETEKPSEIVNNVEKILEFNKQNQLEEDLKMLTPDQMLSRLPITLTQLKAGSNSEKLKNKIRQLFYSLHRSKKLTKQLYKSLVDIFFKMETIFISTKNSKTNEPHKFRLSLSDKFNLKNPNKNIALGNSSIYYT